MEIDDLINEYKKYFPVDIIITGGEPTIYPLELTELCKRIKDVDKNIFITLETNGTSANDFLDYIDLASISPKLSSSVPYNTEFENTHEKNRIIIDVLKEYHFKNLKKLFDIQWKFVVSDEKDLEEIKTIQNEIGFENKNVFLMPEGLSSSELINKRPALIEVCKEFRYNYSDRLHILVWGNKRGV